MSEETCKDCAWFDDLAEACTANGRSWNEYYAVSSDDKACEVYFEPVKL